MAPSPLPDIGLDADAAERLLDIAAESIVELLYVNGEGRRHERIVRPSHLRSAGGHDWLDAREPAAGNGSVTLRLDRIAAIRG